MRTNVQRTASVFALTASLFCLQPVLGGAGARAAASAPYERLAPLGTYDDAAGAEILATQINTARKDHGLPPLAVRADLTAIAQDHSRAMAATGKIWHSDELFSESTRTRLGAGVLGENVGFDGGGTATSHQMYMDSPAHRANILDPRFTAMGVAVTVAEGIAYSTEDFMQGAPPPPPAPPAPSPPPPNTASPPTTEPVAAQASTPRAAPASWTAVVAPTRATMTVDAAPRIATPVASTRPLHPLPAPLVAGLSLVNAALARATVRVARRDRRATR